MSNDIEIDLFKLFSQGFFFLKKNKWVIIFFFLIGFLYGLVRFLNTSTEYKFYYKKTFVVESSVFPDNLLLEIIDSFKEKIILNIKNGEIMPAEFGLQPSTIKKFKSVKVNLKANANLVLGVQVSIEVYEKQYFDSLINKIKYYVNSNEYLQTRYNLIQKQNLQLLTIVNKQIEELDSLKQLDKAFFMKSERLSYLSYVELFEKKGKIEKDLALNKTIDFIEINSSVVSFTQINKGILSILKYAFLGLILGIITGLGFRIFSKKKSI